MVTLTGLPLLNAANKLDGSQRTSFAAVFFNKQTTLEIFTFVQSKVAVVGPLGKFMHALLNASVVRAFAAELFKIVPALNVGLFVPLRILLATIWAHLFEVVGVLFDALAESVCTVLASGSAEAFDFETALEVFVFFHLLAAFRRQFGAVTS